MHSDSNLTALAFTKAQISPKELNCKTNSESNADPPASVCMMSLLWETPDEDGYSEKCPAMKTNDSNVWLVDSTVQRNCVEKDDTASHQWDCDTHTLVLIKADRPSTLTNAEHVVLVLFVVYLQHLRSCLLRHPALCFTAGIPKLFCQPNHFNLKY